MYNARYLYYTNISSGLKITLWGLFKKIVVADNIAIVVNNIYNNITLYDGIILWVGVFLFAIQLYCDFSGYSDMAVGIAKLLGFEDVKNFECPYLSENIKEFWARWHISLSSFFRDYIYIPLGGSRVPLYKRCINCLC